MVDNAVDQSLSEVNLDDLDTSNTSAKRAPSIAGSSSRQKKQYKAPAASGGGGGGPANQARATTDPPAAKPLPKLLIDKNQRARKWDRSSIAIQTLGGEVSLPLWVSGKQKEQTFDGKAATSPNCSFLPCYSRPRDAVE